jgi:Uma2 family endonuclease
MTVSTRAEAFTWTGLQLLPDDGLRRELVHGQLLVTPTPRLRHQRTVLALYRHLYQGCLAGYEVLAAPFDWYLAEDTMFVPDLMVVRRDESDRPREETVPLLVVEVLSPSTASTDRTLKRHEYALAGAANYWIVDPAEPSITALRLAGAAYVEVGGGAGDVEVSLAAPWPVRLRPADLPRP